MKKVKDRNKARCALLVCDMLNDFVKDGAALEVPRARTIIGNIKNELQKARKSHNPIVYCCDAHKNMDTEFNLWPRHAVKGTDGAQVIKQLQPHKQDYLVDKTSYSCFYRTSLDRLLKKLDITHLIITGVVTNICILYTTADAYMRGYKVEIPENCVAALTQREHQFALQQMKRIFHADVIHVS